MKLGLKERFNIAHANASGETNKEFLINFIRELRKEIKEEKGIKIDGQYLVDELVALIKIEKTAEVIRDKERCRMAVADILTLPVLGE